LVSDFYTWVAGEKLPPSFTTSPNTAAPREGSLREAISQAYLVAARPGLFSLARKALRLQAYRASTRLHKLNRSRDKTVVVVLTDKVLYLRSITGLSGIDHQRIGQLVKAGRPFVARGTLDSRSDAASTSRTFYVFGLGRIRALHRSAFDKLARITSSKLLPGTIVPLQ